MIPSWLTIGSAFGALRFSFLLKRLHADIRLCSQSRRDIIGLTILANGYSLQGVTLIAGGTNVILDIDGLTLARINFEKFLVLPSLLVNRPNFRPGYPVIGLREGTYIVYKRYFGDPSVFDFSPTDNNVVVVDSRICLTTLPVGCPKVMSSLGIYDYIGVLLKQKIKQIHQLLYW